MDEAIFAGGVVSIDAGVQRYVVVITSPRRMEAGKVAKEKRCHIQSTVDRPSYWSLKGEAQSRILLSRASSVVFDMQYREEIATLSTQHRMWT